MAWSVPTYAGTYMGGQPSNALTALFELIRAVHERQDAINISRTFFIKANGTTSQTIALADLADIQATGSNNYAYQNLKLIRDAIVSMVTNGYFTESTGNTTVYTKASLETAASADLTSNPTRPQDANYWQGLQDALDLLIYARRVASQSASSPTTSDSDIESTRALAWAGRNTNTPSLSGVTNSDNLVWEIFSSTVRVRGRHTNTITYSHPGFSGTLTGAFLQYSTDVFNTASVNMDLVCDGETASLDVSGDEDSEIEISSSPTLSGNFNVTCTLLGDDATVPFAASGTSNVQVTLPNVYLYFDIASELTDQA